MNGYVMAIVQRLLVGLGVWFGALLVLRWFVLHEKIAPLVGAAGLATFGALMLTMALGARSERSSWSGLVAVVVVFGLLGTLVVSFVYAGVWL